MAKPVTEDRDLSARQPEGDTREEMLSDIFFVCVWVRGGEVGSSFLQVKCMPINDNI